MVENEGEVEEVERGEVDGVVVSGAEVIEAVVVSARVGVGIFAVVASVVAVVGAPVVVGTVA